VISSPSIVFCYHNDRRKMKNCACQQCRCFIYFLQISVWFSHALRCVQFSCIRNKPNIIIFINLTISRERKNTNKINNFVGTNFSFVVPARGIENIYYVGILRLWSDFCKIVGLKCFLGCVFHVELIYCISSDAKLFASITYPKWMTCIFYKFISHLHWCKFLVFLMKQTYLHL
jgi:hypothetical protein